MCIISYPLIRYIYSFTPRNLHLFHWKCKRTSISCRFADDAILIKYPFAPPTPLVTVLAAPLSVPLGPLIPLPPLPFPTFLFLSFFFLFGPIAHPIPFPSPFPPSLFLSLWSGKLSRYFVTKTTPNPVRLVSNFLNRIIYRVYDKITLVPFLFWASLIRVRYLQYPFVGCSAWLVFRRFSYWWVSMSIGLSSGGRIKSYPMFAISPDRKESVDACRIVFFTCD